MVAVPAIAQNVDLIDQGLFQTGENAFKFVKENFTKEKYGGQIYKVLKVIKNDRNPASLVPKQFITEHMLETLSGLNREIAEKNTCMAGLETLLKQRDAEIGNLKETITQKDLHISHLEGTGMEKDIEILIAVAEEAAGERIVMGVCDDNNYKTIVAAALAHGHLVDARTAMDVNLAKQLNILISDVGLPLNRVLMDPTTAALGYGVEYGYSAMERLRLAALQGDGMTQQPMLVTPGEEAWRMKEAKVGADVPAAWGDWKERAVTWETLTAVTLLHSGADIVALRHPESVSRVKDVVSKLWKKGE